MARCALCPVALAWTHRLEGCTPCAHHACVCERWRHAGLPCPQRAFSPQIIDHGDGDDSSDDLETQQLDPSLPCSLSSVSMNAVTEIGEVCAISRCPLTWTWTHRLVWMHRLAHCTPCAQSGHERGRDCAMLCFRVRRKPSATAHLPRHTWYRPVSLLKLATLNLEVGLRSATAAAAAA